MDRRCEICSWQPPNVLHLKLQSAHKPVSSELLMTSRALYLHELESRLAPAIASWDGGGANNLWSTPQNWVGDVAPMLDDELVFPTGAAQLANVNDFAARAGFASINISGE